MTEASNAPKAIVESGEKSPVLEINFQEEVGKLDLQKGLKNALGGAWGDGAFSDEVGLDLARKLNGSPADIQEKVSRALLAIGPGMGHLNRDVVSDARDNNQITEEQFFDVMGNTGQARIDSARELFKDDPQRLEEIDQIEQRMLDTLNLFGIKLNELPSLPDKT